jgi:Tfp pilus assembly protein PilV
MILPVRVYDGRNSRLQMKNALAHPLRNFGCKNRAGFSLVEAVIATVVLGIAAAGVLLPFADSAASRAEGMRRTLAANLAAGLMEQIINTPFEQIVDKFNNYTEQQGQVKDATGAIFTSPIYAKFSRTVSCQYVYVPQESGAAQPEFIKATVQVYYEGRQVAAISRLITK